MKRLSLAILGLCAAAFAADNLGNWTKYKVITLNTKASGANLAGGVAKFPVLVRLDSTSASDVFAQALTGGADIRFSNAAGVQTAYQIESWDATAKKASIWVLADTVKANDSSAVLKMYWGRPGATSASNGAAVFDTANGFRAVWHMSGTTSENDATVNGNTMTQNGTPASVSGAIGGARYLDSTAATRQYFTAANTASSAALNIGSNSPLTISAWVYSKGFSAATNGYGNSIVNKGDRQYCLQSYGNPAATAKRWENTVFAASNGWRETIADKVTPDTAVWHYVTGTWSGGTPGNNMTGRFYVDGVKGRDTSLATAATSNQVQTFDVFIGVNPNGSGSGSAAPNTISTQPRPWHGYIDEVTISAAQRDSNWVALSYATQRPVNSVVGLGASVTLNAATPVLRYVPTNTAAIDTLPIIALNEAVTITPTYVGNGPIDSVVIIGTATLPTGLTLNKATGVISGTTTAAFTAAVRTFKVFSGADTASRQVRIPAAVQPLAFAMTGYTQDTAVYTLGAPVANGPKYTGRTPVSFTVTPALPAGLTLDAATGVIMGRATAAVAAANYTIKGTVPANLVHPQDTSSRVVRITTSGTADDYTTWTRHRPLWLNTGAGTNGAAITAAVTNIPVLVRLTNDTAVTQALAGGADIRFSKANGTTPLAYEIESWNTTAKSAAIWVLVDTVLPGSVTQTIQMHWGKTGATSQSNGAAVFSSANGFQAVVHMNAGGTGNEKDVSTRGFAVTAFGAPKDTVGIVGRARAFDGATNYMQFVNSFSGPLNHQLNENLTLSAWAYPTAVDAGTTGNKLIEKGDNQYTLQVYGATSGGGKFWEFTIRANNAWNQCTANSGASGNSNCLSAAASIDAGTQLNSWHHVVGTYTKIGPSGAAAGSLGGSFAESLYVDGAPINNRTLALTSAVGRVETYNTNIGAEVVNNATAPDGAGNFDRYWTGFIDEARISNVTRGADWNKLEFANQMANQNFVRFAAPTTAVARGIGQAAAGLGMNVKSLAGGLMFSIKGAGAADKATLSLVDMWGRTVFNSAFPNGQNLAWNGLSNNGQAVSAGIYIARIRVVDAQTGASKVLESRVPFTR